MFIRLNTQEIIDSSCHFCSKREGRNAQHFQVNLRYDQGRGISADVLETGMFRDREHFMNEQNLIDAVCEFLSDVHNMNINLMDVELTFSHEEGFAANVRVGE